MKVTITGIEDVNHILATVAPREAINLLRTTSADMAKQLSKDAKEHAPNDPATQEWVGDSFTYKRDKGSRTSVGASVIIKKGKDSRSFIWRFLEYGTGPENVEHAMFLKSLNKMKSDMMQVYLRTFGKKYEALLRRKRK